MEQFDEPVVPDSESVPPRPSVLKRRLAVGALVVAAAVGGVGYGVASAQDEPDPVPPATDDTDAKPGCNRDRGGVDTGIL